MEESKRRERKEREMREREEREKKRTEGKGGKGEIQVLKSYSSIFLRSKKKNADIRKRE